MRWENTAAKGGRSELFLIFERFELLALHLQKK
jgi:hypothetical protein